MIKNIRHFFGFALCSMRYNKLQLKIPILVKRKIIDVRSRSRFTFSSRLYDHCWFKICYHRARYYIMIDLKISSKEHLLYSLLLPAGYINKEIYLLTFMTSHFAVNNMQSANVALEKLFPISNCLSAP